MSKSKVSCFWPESYGLDHGCFVKLKDKAVYNDIVRKAKIRDLGAT